VWRANSPLYTAAGVPAAERMPLLPGCGSTDYTFKADTAQFAATVTALGLAGRRPPDGAGWARLGGWTPEMVQSFTMLGQLWGPEPWLTPVSPLQASPAVAAAGSGTARGSMMPAVRFVARSPSMRSRARDRSYWAICWDPWSSPWGCWPPSEERPAMRGRWSQPRPSPSWARLQPRGARSPLADWLGLVALAAAIGFEVGFALATRGAAGEDQDPRETERLRLLHGRTPSPALRGTEPRASSIPAGGSFASRSAGSRGGGGGSPGRAGPPRIG